MGQFRSKFFSLEYQAILALSFMSMNADIRWLKIGFNSPNNANELWTELSISAS